MKYCRILLPILLPLAFGCYKQDDYTQPFDEGSFNLALATETLPADGSSTSTIVAEIPGDADDSFSQITFKTTAGVFAENNEKNYTVKAKKVGNGDVKRAEATIRSSTKVENAVISIELFEHKKMDTVQFVQAFPAGIQLTPNSFSIKPSNTATGEITIEALLNRSPGIPTLGTLVDMVAYDSNFITHPGSFRAAQNRTNEMAKASFTYVLGDSVANNAPKAYLGRLYIVGRTLNSSAQPVADTVQIISSR